METSTARKFSTPNNQDLQFSKITRYLSVGVAHSHGNGGVIDNNIVTSGNGSLAYRNSCLNTLTSTKPNLNKELMHKLRSMTETIKVLSEENELLVMKNQQLLQISQKNDNNSEYCDEKSNGKTTDNSNLKDHSLDKPEVEVSTGKVEKDKYKSLARRLKEERNQFRERCEEKQREQTALQIEIEKMSEMIGELRDECQKLQQELQWAKQPPKIQKSIGVQVSIHVETNSRASTRRSSTGSNSIISQEAMKRVKSVYGPKQPKPRIPAPIRDNRHGNSSSSSSVSSLKDGKEIQPRKSSTRNATTSAAKPSLTKPPSRPMTGAVIARPVIKPVPALAQVQAELPHIGTGSPILQRKMSPLSCAPSSHLSNTSVSSNISPTSRILSPSRIPSPKVKATRIPSAPRYQPPVRAIEIPQIPSPSPPLPPPPLDDQYLYLSDKSTSESDSKPCTLIDETSGIGSDLDHNCRPDSRSVSPNMIVTDMEERSREDDFEYGNNEIDEEILRIHEDGKVEMLPTTTTKTPSMETVFVDLKPESQEEPIVPNIQLQRNDIDNLSDRDETKVEQVSADDEGSRDGDEAQETGKSSPLVPCTPRTKRKVDHLKQGLAARRIQRTWKHFYQELEERKVQLPANSTDSESEKVTLSEDYLKAFSKTSSPVVCRTLSPSTKSEVIPAGKTFQIEAKTKLKANSVSKSSFESDDSGLTFIEMDVDPNDTKLSMGLRAKFHTARPWQKKIEVVDVISFKRNTTESSEEEMDQVINSIQSILDGNSSRKATLQQLEKDRDLFTSGKVSQMRAVLNARRTSASRSDGITDDDDEMS